MQQKNAQNLKNITVLDGGPWNLHKTSSRSVRTLVEVLYSKFINNNPAVKNISTIWVMQIDARNEILIDDKIKLTRSPKSEATSSTLLPKT